MREFMNKTSVWVVESVRDVRFSTFFADINEKEAASCETTSLYDLFVISIFEFSETLQHLADVAEADNCNCSKRLHRL